ncbi:hypothetical protein RHS04_01382 [Rhizoctonia solani]|uniref:Uncharacterized protein n=1 Tax=Rhizoctonia solani TaxID=456999 RepID=A0A8H7HEN7_9AGAM
MSASSLDFRCVKALAEYISSQRDGDEDFLSGGDRRQDELEKELQSASSALVDFLSRDGSRRSVSFSILGGSLSWLGEFGLKKKGSS